MAYQINRGVGTQVEFKGLKSQYLMYFFFEVIGGVFLYMILNIIGISTIINLLFVLPLIFVSISYTFKFNKKYGQYGLIKMTARRAVPRFITIRKPIYKIIFCELLFVNCFKICIFP